MRSVWDMATRRTVIGVNGPERAIAHAEALTSAQPTPSSAASWPPPRACAKQDVASTGTMHGRGVGVVGVSAGVSVGRPPRSFARWRSWRRSPPTWCPSHSGAGAARRGAGRRTRRRSRPSRPLRGRQVDRDARRGWRWREPAKTSIVFVAAGTAVSMTPARRLPPSEWLLTPGQLPSEEPGSLRCPRLSFLPPFSSNARSGHGGALNWGVEGPSITTQLDQSSGFAARTRESSSEWHLGGLGVSYAARSLVIFNRKGGHARRD